MVNGDDMISEGGPVVETEKIIAVQFVQHGKLTLRFTEDQFHAVMNNDDWDYILDSYLSDMPDSGITWDVVPDDGTGWDYDD